MNEILTTVIYYYQWQNALAEAQTWAKRAGFELVGDIGINNDTIQIRLRLPPGVDRNGARAQLSDLMNQDGMTLVFSEPDPDPVVTPPPPAKTLPLRNDGEQTGQGAINVFKRAFGDGLSPSGSPWYILKLVQSGLSAAGIFTPAGRARPYTVPPYFYIEEMLGLDGGQADRDKLLDALK